MRKMTEEDGKKIACAETRNSGSLRAAAEERQAKRSLTEISSRSMVEIMHELEVCQIELEMQNDELRRSQAIMEESRNFYANFFDFAPLGCLTLVDDGKLKEINLTGASLLGEERNKLLDKNFVDFIPPEDRGLWRQHFNAVLQQDKKLTCEIKLRREAGGRLHVKLDSLRLLREGKAPLMCIAMTDITDRKHAEETLCEQEEFFRMITENIEDYIAVLDLEGRRLYISPSYATLFNDIESMKGSDSFAQVHPDDREKVKLEFNKIVQSGTGLHIEYRFVKADGSVRLIESRGGLVKNALGQASRVVVISRDITERKKTEDKIHKLAFCDTLTLLPNRRMLDDRMIQAIASSKRSGRYCALMFLDLDNFKPLNDLYGHYAGDMLLVEVAKRISSCVREVDTVARFGGDEFVIMVGELDVDRDASMIHAKAVAEKIRIALAKPYFLSIKNDLNEEIKLEHRCTSSIGVVMFSNHEYSPEELLKRADLEMYHAKENGRNQVCFLKTDN